MIIKYILAVMLLITSLAACREDDLLEENVGDDDTEIVDSILTPDWTDATHSKGATLDYETVFNQTEVLRFDITIDAEDWEDMQSDLSQNLGSSGGRPGGNSLSGDFDPIWVPCSFNFEDKEWYKVGIRFKGNSSLQSAYQSGNGKLSLKLDFDEFESTYPTIKNQRFYGFKQLNLNNNFDDASLMREKVGADLFRSFGLASAMTSFCVIYVDYGSGPQYFGVYTVVEEVDDTVIETQFSDGSGNLYKPDGDAASFAKGTFDTSEMELKTNKDSANYGDVELLNDVINSSLRTSDTEQWKSNLERVLDVDNFLKWLAANIVIQNWDTYGRMTHNYYLYNNPENSLLTWIPWDNNEAFQYGKQGGALSLSLSEVSSSWPLMSYIIADSEYKAVYEGYLKSFVEQVYVSATMSVSYDKCYNLLKDYAYDEESGYTFIVRDSYFDSAVESLKTHVTTRNSAVKSYLD